jgi:hypothetical protein
LALPLAFVALATSCATSPSASSAGSSSPARVAAASTERGAFVVRLGNDTVTVEQFTRTADRVEGDILQRAPTTSVAHYVLTLNSDGTPQRLELSTRRPDGSLMPNQVRSVTVQYGRDTVATQIVRDTVARLRMVAPGAFPLINNSYALFETTLGRIRVSGIDSTTVPLLNVGAGQATGWPMRIVSPEAARIWYFGSPQLVTLDRDGRILRVDATGTTNKITVERVPAVDVKALAVAFAARDAAGQGFGATASPRDTARATIGSANITVDYGRPSVRGRNVWQNGVLGDTIWRTGANAATQLTTSADLVVAGTTIPAGKYTLWTRATPQGRYELIFNRQVGQWGTVYNAAQDLVRVPLEESDVSHVERFTITIENRDAGGVLRLAWGPKQLSLPFTVR